MKQSLPIEQQSTFTLKLLAGKYLQQRSTFFETSIHQQWKGDYLLLVNFEKNILLVIHFFYLARRKSTF
jgi:hypothetical protein